MAAAAVTALALVLSSGTSAVATPSSPAALPQAAPALDEVLEDGSPSLPVTLITGDTVHVSMSADGQPVVQEMVPDEDTGRAVDFQTVTREGETYVIPQDALELLGEGVLDWELFNVGKLAAHVLDGTVDEVPVIVSHSDDRPAAKVASADGVTAEQELSSIDATAMTVDGDGQWWQQVSGSKADGAARTANASPLAGVEKVWLNELVQIQLDESVPQVGAPTAWGQGYDGEGTTVAVLDTGIDPNHADVADQIVEAVDFTGTAPGAVDGHGHGTHVAATIAGTGAASDGQRPGVAPGADLAIGKVLDDGGSGTFDMVIAGMQWAAQSGADVVNMSLGSPATDGTDPLSLALNQLSLQHGTLFAVAAGNDGPASETVGAPGAADEALTVAAVDKSDEMAPFSSRGPRVGDGAAKPDIAAPGVNIVAARAAGTSMGAPVDDFYTAANGTSMATPHVAGAAAIVAQQNPELDPRTLKALLMDTALDLGHDIYAQGAGRLDVAHAVDPSIVTTGDLNFGRLPHPHGEVLTKALTFTNFTEEPITLSLAESLEFADGTPAPAGMFTMDSDEVTVPAEDTVDVEATLDTNRLPEDGPYGQYQGLVTATDSAGELRAAVRATTFLEPKRHELTIEITPRDGVEENFVNDVLIVPMDDQVGLYDEPVVVPGGETVTASVFAGSYAVSTSLTWAENQVNVHRALLADPEVTVDGPTNVGLDARQAVPVRAEASREKLVYEEGIALERVSAAGTWSWTGEVGHAYKHRSVDTWVLPTEPVTEGTFFYQSDHILVPPTVSMRVTGGGPALEVTPRYGELDVSDKGSRQAVARNDGSGWTDYRYALHQLSEIESRRPLPVVDGGAGIPEDLAGIDADGALVLMRPLDLITDFSDVDIFGNPLRWYSPIIRRMDWEQLRARIAAATDAGAAGVILANDLGQHLGMEGPRAPDVECPDGPESCPPVEPYLPLPTVTVPATTADELADRLSRPGEVRVRIRGDREVDEVYAFAFTGDHVPDLPHQVDESDLVRVEHHIHADQPGETAVNRGFRTGFEWTRIVPGSEVPPPHISPTHGAARVNHLPRVATQRSVTMYVNRHPGAIDQFAVYPAEYGEDPFVMEPPDVPAGTASTVWPNERVELVLDHDVELDWNAGPSLPVAASQATTDSGFQAEPTVFCSGCRAGDQFVPAMYVGSTAGHRGRLIGLVNDQGVASLGFDTLACEPPLCEVRLRDAAGDELEQQELPLRFGVGGSAGEPILTGIVDGQTTKREVNR